MSAQPAGEGPTERALKLLLFSKFERRLRRAELGAYVATMVSAMVAVAAIIGAVWQVGEARKTEREATAYEAFDAYLRLALEYPQLSCPSTQEQYDAIAQDQTLAMQYSFFTGVMLSAAEQILQARPNDEYWKEGVWNNLACHAPALSGIVAAGGHYQFSCALRDELSLFMEDPAVACTPQERRANGSG